MENKRSFRELDAIKNKCQCNGIVIVGSLSSLGINDNEIAIQLGWFINKPVILVICNIPSTYEYGFSQPMNKAVLSAILQTAIGHSKNIVTIPQDRKSNAGRHKTGFPSNWDDLYNKWTNKEISSKDFIKQTGLKKATFYNLLTEYKEIQQINAEYIKKYRPG